MKKYGLIGDPIATSLSPALFKAAYGGRYAYDLIEGSDFLTSWKTFLSDYEAINVTAPFKEAAFEQALGLARDGLGVITGPVFKTGATNLLVKTARGIEAHNSDFSGIILSVAEACFPGITAACYRRFGARAHIKVHQFVRENLPALFQQRPQALVVGCGGAGKAAAVAAAEMGFSTVLMNRTLSKALDFAARLPEYGFLCDPVSDFIPALRECDLVVYTLPLALNDISKLTPADLAYCTSPEKAPDPTSHSPSEKAPDPTSHSPSEEIHGPSGDLSNFADCAPSEKAPDPTSHSPSEKAPDPPEAGSVPPCYPPSEKVPSGSAVGNGSVAARRPPKIILEANYKTPSLAPCLSAGFAGASYISGRQWLINQAISGYGIMTGEQPDYPAVRSAI